MKSTSTPLSLVVLIALVFIANGGIRPVDARRPHWGHGFFGRRCQRVLFVPITSPTTDDTCAADYADRDNNGVDLLENGRFTQEFLENVGEGNNITVCHGYIRKRDPSRSMFRVKTFQVNTTFTVVEI
ncbi:hypothetical protein TCAL_15227 [Tigriopus californicus]|uniref:Uncharacterized protein n=1 Tax=Tigriopus californicus TaxID=6832 RepID=A0A553NEM8_TIGCA|nr:uncharacterized protein LOC131888130 [Tigriopus californicus]TRY63819.1 hypothetical protein TCAL_15227 [Tigriopus californicus]